MQKVTGVVRLDEFMRLYSHRIAIQREARIAGLWSPGRKARGFAVRLERGEPAMRDWCEENCTGLWWAVFANVFLFEQDNEAILFYMRWAE